jgi:hypothetical protein
MKVLFEYIFNGMYINFNLHLYSICLTNLILPVATLRSPDNARLGAGCQLRNYKVHPINTKI